MDLLNYAKENEFAIPGVNVVSSSSVNACMEAAKKAGGPVMVTFSRGGGQLLGTEVTGVSLQPGTLNTYCFVAVSVGWFQTFT